MSIFWTIVAVVLTLAVLVLSHTIAWLRGFESGTTSAKLEALNERAKGLNERSAEKLAERVKEKE